MATYMVKDTTTQQFAAVPDDQVTAYAAEGWTEATEAEIAAWQASDVYGGTQGAPAAPPLEGTSGEPPPDAGGGPGLAAPREGTAPGDEPGAAPRGPVSDPRRGERR